MRSAPRSCTLIPAVQTNTASTADGRWHPPGHGALGARPAMQKAAASQVSAPRLRQLNQTRSIGFWVIRMARTAVVLSCSGLFGILL